MLWLIVPADAKAKDNKALEVAAGRLQRNMAIPSGQTDTLIVSTSKDEAFTPEKIADEEPKVLHVVAHAGLEHGGHIGGLDLDGFAAALVTKFGTWLTDADVYLHVCLIGRVLDGLLDAVKKADTDQAGAPLDVEALQHANTELQQRNVTLAAQLDERDRELAAARAANRDLMIQLNVR